MRRFQSLLLAVGLVAAPVGAVAKPSDQPLSDSWMMEKFEFSTSKGRLGVMVMSLTDELRTHFGSANKTGVLVARVEPGSSAARAGIAVGDLIVEVKGKPVDDAGDVLHALADVDKNAGATVKVFRDKKPMTIDVRFDGDTTSTLDAFPGFKWLREMFSLGNVERSTST
jgi:S1-C subfamily serine protease